MFLALVLAAAPAAPIPPAPATADWKAAIEFREFKFNPDHSDAKKSAAAANNAGVDGGATYVREAGWNCLYVFRKKDCPPIQFKGHPYTPVVVRGDALYVAEYHPGSPGCWVAAYDLTTGKKAWEKHLDGIGPVDHSEYSNRVAMAVEKHPDKTHFALVITGEEAAGSYIEVLDLITGKQLAHKTYFDKK
jgi:hypothetical protein